MNIAGSAVPDEIGRHLLPGETLVWWDHPGRGLLLTPRDGLLVPLSLLWCGITLYWATMAWHGPAPLPFLLIGAVFTSVGLFLVFGRFLLDMWLRGLTTYALTDRRVLIARQGSWPNFEALALERLPEATLAARADGTGTIRFGRSASPFAGGWVASLDRVPHFLRIKDVRRVFAAVQERSLASR